MRRRPTRPSISARSAANYATTVNPDRTVSTSIKEEIDDIAFRFSGAAEDGKPVNASGRLDKAALHIGADGLKTRKAFDLASLLSAHRADLAAHEAELKGLLKELAAPGLKLAEGGEASKLMVSSPYGAIALAGLKLAIGVANAGPKSAIEATAGGRGLEPAGRRSRRPARPTSRRRRST